MIPEGVYLDPLKKGAAVKAAFYSCAFIIRSIAAELLDIDPEELDISHVRRVEIQPGVSTGEIVMSDHLPNGAGFTRWIATHLQQILGELQIERAAGNTFVGSLISDDHCLSCDASCYDCLRQYRNMSYHGLLDWRLGVGLLRILAVPNYHCGIDGDFRNPELRNWPEMASSLRDMFVESFGCTTAQFGPLPGLRVGAIDVIMVHPLWNTLAPGGVLARAVAAAREGNTKFLDTFNALRRPSRAYQYLGEET